MSTRCQIGIYESNEDSLNNYVALLYRHFDGYPGKVDGSEYGVLSEIVPFVKNFISKRGFDTEYIAARLIQFLTNEHDNEMKKAHKRNKLLRNPYYRYLGYGICNQFHSDIEYFYAIKPDCIVVYEPTYTDNYELEESKKWKKVQTIKL